MPTGPNAPFQGPKNAPRQAATLPPPTKTMSKPQSPAPKAEPKLGLLDLRPTPGTARAGTKPPASPDSPALKTPALGSAPLKTAALKSADSWTLDARHWADVIIDNADRIRAWLTPYACATIARVMCESSSRFIPNYRDWLVPKTYDLPQALFKLIHSPDWIENNARKAALMIGNSAANVNWSSSILAGIAMYQVIDQLAANLESTE